MNSVCVLGLGRFGQTLALELSKENCQVMIIDENEDIVSELADSVTNAVIGNPASETLLKASGIKDYDCVVVCMDNNMDDSIFVTLTLKELGIKKIVARAESIKHKGVLEKIGADVVVFPEQDMGERLAHTLTKNNVLEYIDLSDDYSIVEVKVPDKWIGKSIIDLEIRKKYHVTVIAVSNPIKGTKDISPMASRVFEKDENVALLGSETDIDTVMNRI